MSPPTAGTAGPDLGEDALGGVAGAAIGAVAGAAAGGPAGAIVGAIVGAVGGAAVTEAAADPAARSRAVADGPVDPAARDEAQPALGAAGRDLQGPAGTWTAAVSNARPIEETPVPGSEPGPNAGDDRTVIDEEDPPVPPGGIERMV